MIANSSIRPGYVFLLLVLSVGAITATIAIGLLLMETSSLQNGLSVMRSSQALAAAQTCAERALLALRSDPTYVGNETVTLPTGECRVLPIGGDGNRQRSICALGTSESVSRRLEIAVATLLPTTRIASWREVSSFSLCASSLPGEPVASSDDAFGASSDSPPSSSSSSSSEESSSSESASESAASSSESSSEISSEGESSSSSFSSSEESASSEASNETGASSSSSSSEESSSSEASSSSSSGPPTSCNPADFHDADVAIETNPTIFTGMADHCYIAFNNPVSWTDSEHSCETIGGHLVTYGDQRELSTVEGRLGYSYWIGLTGAGIDPGTNEGWHWVDGTPFSYQVTRWDFNQPDVFGDTLMTKYVYEQRLSGYTAHAVSDPTAAGETFGPTQYVCECDTAGCTLP